MRIFSVMAAVAVCVLTGCAPFQSYHSSLRTDEVSVGSHYQSYYLPKTYIVATLTKSGKTVSITLKKEKVPDRDQLYRVAYQRSAMHDDEFEIATTSQGYLSSVKAHSTDQTAAIVESAAKIFLSNVGGKSLTGIGLRSLPSGALSQETHLIEVQFDPFDPADFGPKNRMLGENKYCIAIFDRLDRLMPGSCNPGWRASARASLKDGASHEPAPVARHAISEDGYVGFYYRRPMQHKVVVYQQIQTGAWRPIWSGWEAFENQADIYEVRVNRGQFIKLQANLTFEEGVLTKYTLGKPSEVLGFLAIPTIIVNTVVQIPGLQVDAAEARVALRERAVGIRQRELDVREKEIEFRRLQDEANQANGGEATTRNVAGIQDRSSGARDELHRIRMNSCLDQKGITESECRALVGASTANSGG